MAFFRNSTINLLNLHYGIHAVAMGGGGAFFAAYLLKSGVSVPMTLVSLALILIGRFAIRPLIVPLAVRFGVRALVMAGTVVCAVQYLVLAEVGGVGTVLFTFCFIAALADTLYWPSYHAYFAALGDPEHRGQQIGVREAIAAGVRIFSPMATAWMLVEFGPRVAFGVTALVVVFAVLPISYTPDVRVARVAPGAFKAAIPSVLIFIADGWIAAGYVFAWEVALFLALGQDFMAFGGALALAAIAGAISGLVLGRHIDAGHGTWAVLYAFGTLSFIILIRTFAPGDATLAVLANALGALGACLYVPTIMTPVYNEAKKSPDSLRFHVACEGGWDTGGASGLLVSALLVWMGAPLGAVIALSLVGVVALVIMVRRYYEQNPKLESSAAAEQAIEVQP
jgi:MFS transporter, DHA1 family, inner membrane transport protein